MSVPKKEPFVIGSTFLRLLVNYDGQYSCMYRYTYYDILMDCNVTLWVGGCMCVDVGVWMWVGGCGCGCGWVWCVRVLIHSILFWQDTSVKKAFLKYSAGKLCTFFGPHRGEWAMADIGVWWMTPPSLYSQRSHPLSHDHLPQWQGESSAVLRLYVHMVFCLYPITWRTWFYWLRIYSVVV